MLENEIVNLKYVDSDGSRCNISQLQHGNCYHSKHLIRRTHSIISLLWLICISIGLNNMLLFIKAKRISLQQKIYGLHQNISIPEYSKHHFEILLRIWYFHSSLWSEIIFKCCFLFLNDNELLIVRYHQLTIEKTSRNYSNCSKLIIWHLLLHWKLLGKRLTY